MRNLAAMMQKAKDVQNNLAQLKEELAALRFIAVSGNGAVEIEVNGRGDVTNVTLSPNIIGNKGVVGLESADDVAMLEDLILIAVNDARGLAANAKAEKMKDITGDLPLPPGLDLPL